MASYFLRSNKHNQFRLNRYTIIISTFTKFRLFLSSVFYADLGCKLKFSLSRRKWGIARVLVESGIGVEMPYVMTEGVQQWLHSASSGMPPSVISSSSATSSPCSLTTTDVFQSPVDDTIYLDIFPRRPHRPKLTIENRYTHGFGESVWDDVCTKLRTPSLSSAAYSSGDSLLLTSTL